MDELFWEIHSGLPQQGPGCEESTIRALSLVPDLPVRPSILDIGCGPGRQTITLAARTRGRIVAVDNHQPFLDELARRSADAGVGDLITPHHGSMTDLPFEDDSFDLIWAEGSIYIMGFEAGLAAWRRLVKPGGTIAVTEITWFTDQPDDELKSFWDQEYPRMKTTEQNVAAAEKCGYGVIDTFKLPESSWWDNYYHPIEQRLAEMRRKYAANQNALDFLAAYRVEIDMYRRCSDAYGYVFYIMTRPLEI